MCEQSPFSDPSRARASFAQLAVYAPWHFTKLAGLRLFDIKCAWFDEKHYCEFFPRTLFANRRNR
jgi:hypothetical protein